MAEIIGNRYQLLGEIGRGGMGTVFKGTDTQTGQPVAVKLLKPEAVQFDPNMLERFRREAEALARLNHPNIVKVLDTLEEGDYHYIVMEYCGRGDLNTVIKQESPLPILRVQTLAIEIADALTRAHYLDIIHRDIKPANVLIADDGSPRLTDFGVAHFGAMSPMTGVGMAVGTFAYLPPEALDGETVDSRADIWSFGIMLFEMLTGRKPFESENVLAIASAIVSQPIPDLEALRPDCPVALVDLINRMLEKEPDARIASARLIGAELERMLKGAGEVTTPLFVKHIMPAPPTSRFATPPPDSKILKHNLPAQTTPFVGREQELDQLLKLLGEPDMRLLTILAPGGMGKTRLALETASRVVHTTSKLTSLRRFLPSDGVYFVELAPLTAPEAIVSAVAQATSYVFQQDARGSRQQILDYLREKHMLLILDNFEHILDGALLVGDILREAANVKIIATSRERLNLQEETLFRLAGLDLPDSDAADDDPLKYAAVRLFVQGARRAQPRFELQPGDLALVTQICRLVDGMPLAILLASAWLDSLSLKEIAGEIRASLDFLATDARNVPERQRSMRAVFDYSWNLLTADERGALAALAVFRGGWTRDAAQIVAGASLRQLTALVNKSLLRRDAESGRYGLHELLRQYLESKVDADPAVSNTVRARHAECFVALLAANYRDMTSSRSKAALQNISADLENIVQALRWAVDTGARGVIDALWMPLLTYYEVSGRYSAGAKTFQDAAERFSRHAQGEDDVILWRLRIIFAGLADQVGDQSGQEGIPAHALEVFRERGTPREICFALNIVAYDAMRRGQFHEAKALTEEAAVLLIKTDDALLSAFTLGNQSYIAFLLGDYDEALRLSEIHLERANASGDSVQMGYIRNTRGEIFHAMNREAEAKALFEESHAIFKQIDNRPNIAYTATNIGNVLHRLGRYRESLAPYEESVAIHREIGNRRGLAEASNMLAGAWVMLGEYERALPYHKQALAVFRETGDVRGISNSLAMLNSVEAFLGDYGNAIVHAEECLALRRQMGNPMEIADALGHVSRVYSFSGDYDRAERVNAEFLSLAEQHPAFGFALRGLLAGSAAQVSLLREDYGGVIALIEPNLPMLDGTGQAFILMTVYYTLGRAYIGSGRRKEGEKALHRTLSISNESSAKNWTASALAELAMLKADDGEVESAVALQTLTLEQGKLPHWIGVRVREQRDSLRERLSAEAFEAAVERGQTLNFDTTVEGLLNP